MSRDPPSPRTPPPTPLPRRVVTPFGKYYLFRKIADGGMAELFLGKQVGTQGFERDVVIKRMHAHLSHVADFVEMFLDEARLAARLLHPNIVQIHDLGVAAGAYYICMEYLAGEDLAVLIRKNKVDRHSMPANLAARVMIDVCDAVHFAHEFSEGGRPLNIVHRDLSPSNVIATYSGGVKVVDFGIAKAESRAAQTTAGVVKGKYIYMSPEQAAGDAVDRRSDLFSLGLTFFELLTGVRVFQRDTDLAILKAVQAEPIPSPRKFRPDVPEALEAVVMRALERDPERRYPSAEAMRADLEAFLHGSTSATGGAQLSAYLRERFGAEALAGKTRIPTLRALKESGYLVPDEALNPGLHVPDADVAMAQAPPTVAARVRDEGPRALDEPATQVAPYTAVERSRRRGRVAAAGLFFGAVVVAGTVAAVALRANRAPAVAAVPAPQVPDPAPPTPLPAAPVATAPPPPAPEPPAVKRAPRPEAPRTLRAEDVTAALSRSRARLMACFESNRSALKGEQGQVILKLTIAPTGQVADAKVETPDFRSDPISACIVREAMSMRFPRHTDKAISVGVPFLYEVSR